MTLPLADLEPTLAAAAAIAVAAVAGLLIMLNKSKQAQAELAAQKEKLAAAEKALHETQSALARAEELNAEVTRLRTDEAKYRGMVENAVIGIYQTSPEGRFLAANPALIQMLGYSSLADLTAYVSHIESKIYVEPARRKAFETLIKETNLASAFQSEVRRKDGSVIWINEEARGVRDKAWNLLYYEGFVEDITARKRSEKEILDLREKAENQLANLLKHWTQANLEMQDPLKELRGMEAGPANAAAERLNSLMRRMGEDFSAQATPRAKRGATMLLRRSNTTKIENVESGVLKIPDAGGPVVLLVSRHAEFRQALAADCAKKGYRCLEAATGAAGLTQFHGAWPDAVVLDLNLADAEAWTLLKELKADSESALAPTLLCFSVPEEAGKAARGFTLGCADFIVKPFDAGKIRTVFQRLPETAGGGGKEVLAIDDSAFARVELQKILEAESYTVRLADSGKAGLRRLTEHAPGLILLDLLMPQMDGVEFLNERNRNPQWRAIPLVLASKDLSAPESQKLNQYLKQVLGNSAYESARMREELCALLKASVKNSNPTKS